MRGRTRGTFVWVMVLATLAWAGTVAEAQAAAAFDLPTQPLADSLRAVGSQTNTNVIFDPGLVAARQAPALKGEWTAHQALTHLLAGTGIRHEFLNDETVVLATENGGTGSVPEDARRGAAPPDAASSKVSPVTDVSKSSRQKLRLAQATGTGTDEATAGARTGRAGVAVADNPPSSTGNGDAARSSEEVIVTATKRAENIRDVPLSITALTAEEIDQRGLVDAADYLRGVPGVNQSDDINGNSVIIRGVETSGCCQNNLSGATIATYFGETPTTMTGNGGNVDIKLVDIERVEVLRGAQGTAFGSSALGGAVRTIPVAPKLDRFEGKIAAGYSFTSGPGSANHMIQAVGNIPLIQDKLAIRATAYQFEDSGYYRNVAGSNAAFQQLAAVTNAQAFAVDQKETNDKAVTGGRVAALFQATDNLSFTLSYLTQTTEVTDVAGNGQSTQPDSYDVVWLSGIAPEHQEHGHDNTFLYETIDIGNATVEYDFGWASLLGTFSRVESGQDRALHLQNGFRPWSQGLDIDRTQDAGEIRLATKLEGAWNFLVGLYAEELKDTNGNTQVWYGDPARNNFTPGQRFISGGFQRARLKQEAAFGEVSWEFLPGFTLTGGVRAYDYERITQRQPLDINWNLTGTLGPELRLADTGTSFRGNLSYKFDDGLLYAGWSEGFRLGRANPPISAARCDLNGDGIVDGTTTVRIEDTGNVLSDSVENLELGGKFALLDRRLTIDTAIFRITWDGVPFFVRAPLPPVGCNDVYTANAGGALVEGIELQTQYHITDTLRLDVGGSRMNARLSEDAPAAGARAGARLVNSPKFNANLGLQYLFSIAGHDAYVRADSIYVGSYYGNITQIADSIAGDYVKVDVSARVMIRNLSVDLFVRNLGDEDEFTFRYGNLGNNTQGTRMRPRTIGLQLGYDFGP